MAPENESLALTSLTAISPLDGRYWNKVSELSPYTSESALIKTRFEIEANYLVALSREGVIRPLGADETKHLLNFGQSLTLNECENIKKIEDTTNHDLKAVEIGFRELLVGTSMEDLTEYVHLFLTSEDVNNLAHRLMARRATDKIMVPALDNLTDYIMLKALEYKTLPMIARTHGQEAVPTTLGKELANFAIRINEQTRILENHKLKGKLNGAVGNFNSFETGAPKVDWIKFSKRFIERIGFEPNLFTTQINPYEDLISLFQTYQRINGIILDLDQDAWRYISDHYFALKVVKGEIGSSTMTQKVNPINFENSEGNLEFANAVFSAFITNLPISRLQRDLSDSTLMRNMGVGFGYSLLSYKNTLEGFNRVSANERAISEDLNKDWSILGEPLQQILRMEKVEDPYTLVKNFTRGRNINADEWKELLETSLPQGISKEAIKLIKSLTPQTYLGLAIELTELAQQKIKDSRIN